MTAGYLIITCDRLPMIASCKAIYVSVCVYLCVCLCMFVYVFGCRLVLVGGWLGLGLHVQKSLRFINCSMFNFNN